MSLFQAHGPLKAGIKYKNVCNITLKSTNEFEQILTDCFFNLKRLQIGCIWAKMEFKKGKRIIPFRRGILENSVFFSGCNYDEAQQYGAPTCPWSSMSIAHTE